VKIIVNARALLNYNRPRYADDDDDDDSDVTTCRYHPNWRCRGTVREYNRSRC